VKNEDRIKNIIDTLVNSMKINNQLFPIYDYEGNLLWPQKMSHEEIVKMKEKSDQE
jgi:hypothetical protein